MIYEEMDFEYLEKNGCLLSNPYQNIKRKPILLDGFVYKFFPQEYIRETEKRFLKIYRYHLEYLVKIKKILTKNGKPVAYAYQYLEDPLLKDKIEDFSFDQKMLYIEQLIQVHSFLIKKGLIYLDYHSANALAGVHITLIDIDCIEQIDSFKKYSAGLYLLDLIVSIFLNTDLTFFDDNSNLYAFYANYFHMKSILTCGDIPFFKIFEQMQRTTTGELHGLKEQVQHLVL